MIISQITKKKSTLGLNCGRVLEKVSGSEVKFLQQKRGLLCMKYVPLAFVPDCVSPLDSFHSWSVKLNWA